MSLAPVHRITIVGNAAGGKTMLSRRLSQIYGIPVTHVDSIQFTPGMKIRALSETREILLKVTVGESWLIDGFGPLDLIEDRFQKADRVVFIDMPIWRHYWWLTKRQIFSQWRPREELPLNCDELTLAHTLKLYKTLWKINKKMRPELLKIFKKESLRGKVLIVQNMGDWNRLFKEGFAFF